MHKFISQLVKYIFYALDIVQALYANGYVVQFLFAKFCCIGFYNFQEVIQPPLGFHCIPCISSYMGDDVMMLPEHVTCVNVFKEVLRLFEKKASRGW